MELNNPQLPNYGEIVRSGLAFMQSIDCPAAPGFTGQALIWNNANSNRAANIIAFAFSPRQTGATTLAYLGFVNIAPPVLSNYGANILLGASNSAAVRTGYDITNATVANVTVVATIPTNQKDPNNFITFNPPIRLSPGVGFVTVSNFVNRQMRCQYIWFESPL